MGLRDRLKEEKLRLAALERLNILGSEPEAAYDEIAFLAANLADTPVAVISFVAGDHQWFKAKIGIDICETPRDIAFCAHVIHQTTPLIVNDATQDPRFRHNPLVTVEGLRFYAGFPLIDEGGFVLGALAIIDYRPRELKSKTVKSLEILAQQVTSHLRDRTRLERSTAELRTAEAERNFCLSMIENLNEVLCRVDRHGHFQFLSDSISRVIGIDAGAAWLKGLSGLFIPEDGEKILLALEGETGEESLRLQLAKGDRDSDRWVDLRLFRVPESVGLWNATMTDVTEAVCEQRRADEELENLRGVFEAAPFAMGLVEIRADDVYVLRANRAAASGLGRELIEEPISCRSLGVPDSEILTWRRHYAEAQQRRGLTEFELRESQGKILACTVYPIGDPTTNRFVFAAMDLATPDHERVISTSLLGRR